MVTCVEGGGGGRWRGERRAPKADVVVVNTGSGNVARTPSGDAGGTRASGMGYRRALDARPTYRRLLEPTRRRNLVDAAFPRSRRAPRARAMKVPKRGGTNENRCVGRIDRPKLIADESRIDQPFLQYYVDFSSHHEPSSVYFASRFIFVVSSTTHPRAFGTATAAFLSPTVFVSLPSLTLERTRSSTARPRAPWQIGAARPPRRR